jgi:hypothetical protein
MESVQLLDQIILENFKLLKGNKRRNLKVEKLKSLLRFSGISYSRILLLLGISLIII